ncbi:hypothetical protein JIN85_03315 [Luteolibacter pohnpeiensis]|uniref:Uncharacterized protein n=1 Tax=Luteolibacter pohnpeiensis TaxID=454153 RepID=A0A934S5A8_9BACT|nr:hypothetical protein [Luteolibacter pohnpeiensis]MBK1881429.1 hypothetical protein [Luteolibacter pohnpeiensis]
MQSSPNPIETLKIVRQRLLKLHRELIHSERKVYEQSAGTIPSSAAFLDLLTRDPWFEWLRPISQKIATIDDALADRKNPLTDEAGQFLIDQVRDFMIPDGAASGFRQNLDSAIQRDPDVAHAYAELRSSL